MSDRPEGSAALGDPDGDPAARAAESLAAELDRMAVDIEAATVRDGVAWRLASQRAWLDKLGLPTPSADIRAEPVDRDAGGQRRAPLQLVAPEAERVRPAGLAEPATRPADDHSGYRHEAVFYDGEQDFLAATVPFIEQGLALGQPVMVAVIEERLRPLRTALGPSTGRVYLVDMAVLGHNPARIIPAWRQFVDDNVGYGRPLRGIGEPIWAGRRASELLECQFHEALLNVALDANTPLWLRCPYDIRALAPDVITEARRSHPHTSGRDDQSGSGIYGGSAHPERLFSGELDEPRAEPDVLEFDAASRDSVGQFVIRRALRAGLPAARTADLALAISELARDSTSDRQAHGVLRVWRDDSSFVCEVADGRPTRDLLVGRVAPGQSASADRQSAWLANRLCDLVQIRSHETGSVVRVLTWI